ncbi:MAG: hypothetical protein M9890_02370 [Thermomicrobiales bacterium]|nr:hypothetical protein [Thermomicrobiales bacterium]
MIRRSAKGKRMFVIDPDTAIRLAKTIEADRQREANRAQRTRLLRRS